VVSPKTRDGFPQLGGIKGVAPRTSEPGSGIPPDEASFRALYEAELAYVLRSLRRLGVPESESEELAHDVFVVVHRRWADFDPTRPVRPWLFGITFRTAARAMERSWRRHEQPVDDGVLEAAPAPTAPSAEVRDMLLRALAQVEPDQRVVCILHDLDGQDAPEIALVLGIPVNTVYSRLRLGRQHLAAALRRLNQPAGQPADTREKGAVR
jgi:RNA polymerase sigma-70 factor (ECF subfamily)